MRNTFDPFFMLKVDDKVLPKDLTERITRFEFEDCEDKSNMLTILIDNNDLKYIDEESLEIGGIITFRFGYLDRQSDELKAQIRDHQGFRDLKIIAYQINNNSEKTSSISEDYIRVWKNISYSEIANEVANEMGLISDIEESKFIVEYVSQNDEDNLSFLKRLASEIGYICFVEGDVLYFGHRQTFEEPQMKLTYYVDGSGEVKDFLPSIITNDVPSSSTSISTDIYNKKHIEDTVGQTDTTKLGTEAYSVDGITGKETKIIIPPESSSNDKIEESKHNEDRAIANLIENEMNIESDVYCIGIPEVKARRPIGIFGVGIRYSSNWHVKIARHIIDSNGYETQLETSKNALEKAAAAVEGSKNQKEVQEQDNKKAKVIIIDGITGEETEGYI